MYKTRRPMSSAKLQYRAVVNSARLVAAVTKIKQLDTSRLYAVGALIGALRNVMSWPARRSRNGICISFGQVGAKELKGACIACGRQVHAQRVSALPVRAHNTRRANKLVAAPIVSRVGSARRAAGHEMCWSFLICTFGAARPSSSQVLPLTYLVGWPASQLSSSCYCINSPLSVANPSEI